ncbi:MAG TPA: hypothetical protein VM242_09195, partial [Acidimicrobiales bacterium]|nr:hypothetical protein [Acidimicrobiales bacterium]
RRTAPRPPAAPPVGSPAASAAAAGTPSAATPEPPPPSDEPPVPSRGRANGAQRAAPRPSVVRDLAIMTMTALRLFRKGR